MDIALVKKVIAFRSRLWSLFPLINIPTAFTILSVKRILTTFFVQEILFKARDMEQIEKVTW